MAKVIIFGNSDTAQLAHYYLTKDSDHKVIGFAVHKAYYREVTFCDLPVWVFESLPEHFAVDEICLFAPMTGQAMNQGRTKVFQEIKQMGFPMISYVSSHATVLSAAIGENCFILEDNTIQPFVTIADNVVLWSGNHIGHHSVIEENVCITSHVVVSGHCVIGKNSFLGVNATLRDGIHLAEGTFVAMATCISKDTEAWCAYAGSPAKKLTQPSTEIKIYHDQSKEK